MRKIVKIIFPFFIFFLGLTVSTNTTYAISLDPTFGINGKVITSYGHESYISKIHMQKDGKIISVGGASNGNNLDWAITRYNSNGSADQNFGINGKVKKDFGGGDALSSIKTQTDGKIIVGGYTHSTSNFQWTLARFNSNGQIDSNFGNNGVIFTFIGIHSVLNDIVMQSDEKIVAVGYRQNQGQDDVVIVRYNSDGSLDTTFGNGGIVITPIGTFNDRGNSIALQSDGKIFVFGDFDAGGHDNVFLARYNTNGTLDTSFGSGGKIIDNYEYHNGARGVAIQADGKIVVTGSTNNYNSPADTYVARYNPNGSPDNTFGTNGKFIKSFTNGIDTSNSIILQTDGKIIIGGYEEVSVGMNKDFALRRLNPNGTLDTEFGAGGSFLTPIGSGNDAINSIVQQSDGKIVAAGTVFNGTYNDWGLVRYSEVTEQSLSVPYFSQNDLPWGPTEYDHTEDLGVTGMYGSINRWGCAITSIAMILKYHNINEFPNGIPLDPGSLNTWFVNNDGYLYGYGSDGWYSYINWPSIGRLTKELYDAGKSSVKLEYDYIRSNPTSQTKEILDNDLTEGINEFGPFPDILRVENASTSSHFVVAKGIKEDTYTINDPEWSVSDLLSFNNTYMQVGRYVPSKTDLSYLVMVVNPKVRLLVANSQGKTGNFIYNGTTEIYNEITNASYDFDPPISNQNNEGLLEQLGIGVNSFLLHKPSTDSFTITLSSDSYEKYTLNISSFTQGGENTVNKFEGVLLPNITNTFSLYYDKESAENLSLKPIITLEKLKSGLQELFEQELIDNKGILNSLIKKIDSAIKAEDKKQTTQILNSFINELKAQRNKHIKKEAYELLYYYINILINDAS